MDEFDTGGGETQMAAHTMPVGYVQQHRNRLQYELTVRQEPKQARMCGIGGKADRRPIDPPVIVQLRVIDPQATPQNSTPASASGSQSTSASASASSAAGPSSADPSASADSSSSSADPDDPDAEPYTNLASYAQSFLQNPYYFMFASLAKPDDDTELHWLKDGRTRCTTGSVVSSLYALKDPTAAPAPGDKNKDGPTTAPPSGDAGFFVFPDLSVRTEGSYRLKLSLFEVVGNDVRHCKSIYSAPFYVYTAKKFPGVEESSPLTCSLADQGIKIRIRKDIRMRKARHNAAVGLGLGLGGGGGSAGGVNPGALALVGGTDLRAGVGVAAGDSTMPTVDPDPVEGPGEKQRQAKRQRTDDGTGAGGNTGGAPPVGTPWPSTPLIPPPPGAAIEGGGTVPMQSQQQQVVPPPAPDMGYDRGGPYAPSPYDPNAHAHGHAPPHPQQQHPGQQHPQQHPQQQQQQHIPPPPPPGYRADAMPPPPPPPPHHAPHAHGHAYPPQYQHPYAYAYPPPGPYGYSDPYAHHHHAPPPPPQWGPRYDLNYAYPPAPHPGYGPPYYEQPQPQPQYGEYGQQQQGQGVPQGVPQGGQGQGYAPPPPQQQQQQQQQQLGGNGNGTGTPPNGGTPGMGAPANPGMVPPSGGMVPPSMVPPNPNMGPMPPNPNPNAHAPRGPPYPAYRPYAQPPPPPPYYGYSQPVPPPQQQPQHEAHAWGTPPSGFGAPPPPHPQQQQQQQVWGEYPPVPQQVQQQQQAPVMVPSNVGVGVGANPQASANHGGNGNVVQAPQGQVGALHSPNARIELAPLQSRPREDDGNDGGSGRSPTSAGGHAVIQLRSSSAGRGGGRDRDGGAGKKNPLSIGSIISDEKH
ncbi:velvet factor-domain-containing protein [Mycena olivaceomarginata]|nr:velvet factor-domain-containing protein [Mycena olivaceomarginata]